LVFPCSCGLCLAMYASNLACVRACVRVYMCVCVCMCLCVCVCEHRYLSK
jgi:hypothetical protein